MSQTDINQINILIKQHEEAIESLKKQRGDFEAELDKSEEPEVVESPVTPTQAPEPAELSDEEKEQVEEEREEAKEESEPVEEEPVADTEEVEEEKAPIKKTKAKKASSKKKA